MHLSRCVLPLLILGIATPAAANGRPIHSVEDSFSTEHVRRGIKQRAQIRLGSGRTGWDCKVTASVCHFRVTAPAGDIASVAATLTSAGGDEELTLAETDTRLHGTAAIAAIACDFSLASDRSTMEHIPITRIGSYGVGREGGAQGRVSRPSDFSPDRPALASRFEAPAPRTRTRSELDRNPVELVANRGTDLVERRETGQLTKRFATPHAHTPRRRRGGCSTRARPERCAP